MGKDTEHSAMLLPVEDMNALEASTNEATSILFSSNNDLTVLCYKQDGLY